MILYNQASKKSVEAAVKKARQLRPRARVLGYGLFSVAGSKPGQRYQVQFSFNSQAELVVACECPGSTNGLICYHASAVSILFKGQWSEKRAGATQAAPAPVPVSYCGCGLPVAGSSSYCHEHALEQAAGYEDLVAGLAG